MRPDPDRFVHVGSLAELAAKGRMVIKGRRCPVLVVHDQGRVFALDNRCPHLGFALHKGSIRDGILTCPWHHARFDLASGGTFDLWADDVPTAAVRIQDGQVFVAADCGLRADPATHWRRRLDDGMAHNLGLVIAKAVLGARGAGVDEAELLRDAALFGARMRDGFGIGMTILVALGNVLRELPDTERYLALFHGIRRVAADCAGEAPRRARAPLQDTSVSLEVLRRWFRQWTEVRHRDAAERTLLTAVAQGPGLPELADMMLCAVTDRPFADGGHALDFLNKAFECVELVGEEHAAAILPTVIGQLVEARGADEQNAWRHPLDLVALLAAAFEALPAAVRKGEGRQFEGHAALADALLGDDPQAINAALLDAIRAGTSSPTPTRRTGSSSGHAQCRAGRTSPIPSLYAQCFMARWRCISRASSTSRRRACRRRAARRSTICRQTTTGSAARCWMHSTGSSGSIRAPAWSPAMFCSGIRASA
jgi:nitrite reductase/ring-hydroxylating ferredoxin subunit